MKKYFAIKPREEECLHCGWHGKHELDTVIKGIEQVVDWIDIKHVGAGARELRLAAGPIGCTGSRFPLESGQTLGCTGLLG